MSGEPLPRDFAHMPCGGWCLGECPGCCACGKRGCSGCPYGDDAPTGGIVSGLKPIGEDGCTIYVPVRTTEASTAGLEFDTSPETLQRLREALRRTPGRP